MAAVDILLVIVDQNNAMEPVNNASLVKRDQKETVAVAPIEDAMTKVEQRPVVSSQIRVNTANITLTQTPKHMRPKSDMGRNIARRPPPPSAFMLQTSCTDVYTAEVNIATEEVKAVSAKTNLRKRKKKKQKKQKSQIPTAAPQSHAKMGVMRARKPSQPRSKTPQPPNMMNRQPQRNMMNRRSEDNVKM
eukprot:255520_1